MGVPGSSVTTPMQARFVDGVARIAAAQWDRFAGRDHPFVTHRFLSLLEASGCVGPGTGWTPCPLVLERAGRPLAVVPVYLKSHSWGEYVFDFAWARAYQRAGLRYYPKLVVAVPFSPVTGPRLLAAPDADRTGLVRAAAAALAARAQDLGASSVHWLFAEAREMGALREGGWMARSGMQFHWQNASYGSFEDFLATFSAEKRKKARRERRAVAEAGVTLDVVSGSALDEREWHVLYRFYADTVARHGGQAYLNARFFAGLADRMAREAVIVRAFRDGRWIAAALNLRGGDTLYGRYWGCREDVPGLHFEVCYHRAVEWCIEQGIARYEAGAQGEHKLARGFVPVETCSAHWLAQARIAAAVDDFLAAERADYALYREALMAHAPYRRDSS
jgi:uncharacterized protein